jgi:hypothetical protein
MNGERHVTDHASGQHQVRKSNVHECGDLPRTVEPSTEITIRQRIEVSTRRAEFRARMTPAVDDAVFKLKGRRLRTLQLRKSLV